MTTLRRSIRFLVAAGLAITSLAGASFVSPTVAAAAELALSSALPASIVIQSTANLSPITATCGAMAGTVQSVVWSRQASSSASQGWQSTQPTVTDAVSGTATSFTLPVGFVPGDVLWAALTVSFPGDCAGEGSTVTRYSASNIIDGPVFGTIGTSSGYLLITMPTFAINVTSGATVTIGAAPVSSPSTALLIGTRTKTSVSGVVSFSDLQFSWPTRGNYVFPITATMGSATVTSTITLTNRGNRRTYVISPRTVANGDALAVTPVDNRLISLTVVSAGSAGCSAVGTRLYATSLGTCSVSGVVGETPTVESSSTSTVTITVVKRPASLDWTLPNLGQRYPATISASQLAATSSVPGSWSYSRAVGDPLVAGDNVVTAIFTPTNSDLNEVTPTSQTIPVLLGLARTPTTGTVTRDFDGFTFPVTNFDATFDWAVSSSVGTAELNSLTGLVTVSGLVNSQSATVTIESSNVNYESGSASITSSALDPLPGLTPQTSIPVRTNEGFTFSVLNLDPDYTWAATASAGSVRLDSNTGAVRVSELARGREAEVTVTASRRNHVSESTRVLSGSNEPDPAPPAPWTRPTVAPTAASERTPTRATTLPIDVTDFSIEHGNNATVVRAQVGDSVTRIVAVVTNALGRRTAISDAAVDPATGLAVITLPFDTTGQTVSVYAANELGLSPNAPAGLNVVPASALLPITGTRAAGKPYEFSGKSSALSKPVQQRLKVLSNSLKTSVAPITIIGPNTPGSRTLSLARGRAMANFLSQQGVRAWITYGLASTKQPMQVRLG